MLLLPCDDRLATSPCLSSCARPPGGTGSVVPPPAKALLACTSVSWYIGTMNPIEDGRLVVERVQTGVRMEKRLLKVLKAFAEYHDRTLGDLLEGIVLHAFDGKTPFSEDSLRRIKDLKKFY